ncbi:MAG: tRNA (adenosine(37)-N6)-threonylcarbamoyltransferase complex transferase subunit TsaD [bacterium]
MSDRFILGIDTSCDDTSIATVTEDGDVISNIVSSQIALHSDYGGVVPELAARMHTTALPLVLDMATEQIGGVENVKAICVTCGPGLVGSLLCGLSFAKGLALSLQVPIIGVNHLEGHIFSVVIGNDPPETPFLVSILTGGHTLLVIVEEFGKYTIIGRTLDDAIGEAFDKVARLLGFGYPGGPDIETSAERADKSISFPRPMSDATDYDMSFSGLKTAVMHYVRSIDEKKMEGERGSIARGFQEAVFDVVLRRIRIALNEFNIKNWGIVGGVIANKKLKEMAEVLADETRTKVLLPDSEYAGDNGVMIALCGLFHLKKGETDNMTLSAYPNLHLGEKPSEKLFRK